MARYIDADKFTERIKASPAFRNIYDGLLLQRVVIDLLNNIPTADVVPKSEVEVWKQNRFNLYQRLKLHEIARQKVAREIFEEFERLMENNEVWFGQTDEMREEFAELKKKYTEEKV